MGHQWETQEWGEATGTGKSKGALDASLMATKNGEEGQFESLLYAGLECLECCDAM